jgi:hypothetical protein
LRLLSLQAPITRVLTSRSTNNRLRSCSMWYPVCRTWLSRLWINLRFPASVENIVTLCHRNKIEENLMRHSTCLTLCYNFFICQSTVKLYLESYIILVKVASTYTKTSLNFVQLGTHPSPSLPWNIAATKVNKLLLVNFVLCLYCCTVHFEVPLSIAHQQMH